jgi:hypothetical protein
MTLTVRSASVTGATTASRALTYAEMDANWAGARTAFSLFARSSDANFNTTQAALTETVGVKALRIGSGSSVGLLFPTSSIYGDHYSYVADTTFNGIVDPIKIDGYNPSRVNTAEPSLYWGLEGHYFDGATHYMEENLDYTSSDGLTTKRFFTMQINRATHLATWQWAGVSIQFSNVLDSTPMLFMNSTTLSLGNQSPSASTRIEINGTQNASTSEFGINYLGKAGSGVTNTLDEQHYAEGGCAMKQDVASGAVKVAPPVAAWLFGLTLNDWVAIGTLVYLALPK